MRIKKVVPLTIEDMTADELRRWIERQGYQPTPRDLHFHRWQSLQQKASTLRTKAIQLLEQGDYAGNMRLWRRSEWVELEAARHYRFDPALEEATNGQ